MKKVIELMIYFNKRMIFSISLFLICICGANAAGYNYSKFNWDDYVERYGSYWTNTCDDDETGKCVERVLNTQKKFYNKLYKMLTKYERSGLYVKDEIIVGTIYFGLTPDAFRDDNDNYNNWFQKIAFDFNAEDDDISVDDNNTNYVDLTKEQNTIKLLLKAMVGYEATCSKMETAQSRVNSDGAQEYYCNQGYLIKNNNGGFDCKNLLHTDVVGLGEKILDSSGVLSFFGIKSNAKKECENEGGTYEVASKKTVNEDAYWRFLENSYYFDQKMHLEYYFANVLDDAGLEHMDELDKKMDEDENFYNEYNDRVVAVRKEIILYIKEALEQYNEAHPENNLYYSSLENKYFWPIGSKEIEEKNGKKYATGTPVSSYIIRDYNPGTNDGIDIGSSEENVNIIAVKPGVVSYVFSSCIAGDSTCGSGYGNYVTLSHSDGTYTVYAYLDSVSVSMGESVDQGQIIGIMGSTGDTREKALHFEVKVSTGARVNPNTYVSYENPRPKSDNVSTITGSGNKQTICLTMKTSGASDAGIAGMMANINFESGFISNNLEDKYESKLGYTNETYTSAVDDGMYTNFVNDSAGYGLCQWTYHTRKQGLLNYAKSNGVSISDPGMQVSFLYKELKSGYSSLYNAIMSGNDSVDSITSNFCHNFENPANHTQCDTTRVDIGKKYYTYVVNNCN